MSEATLIVEKQIRATSARLFRAWLTEDDFAAWFLPADSVSIESVSLDPRPGGRFMIHMMLDGQDLPHEGEYLVIEEPTKLVFTWKSPATDLRDTLVTVTFEELPADRGPLTLVTLKHEKLAEPAMQKHRSGWTSILNGLDESFRSK